MPYKDLLALHGGAEKAFQPLHDELQLLEPLP